MSTFAEDEKFIELFQKLLKEDSESEEYEKIYEEFKKAWWDLDRIEIRAFQSKDYARWVKEILELTKNILPPFMEEEACDKRREAEDMGLVDSISIVEDYYSKLVPPFVKQGTKIPLKLKKLFSESRHCFIYRQYNAAIVLSRAIVESVIKQKLGPEDYFSSKLLKASADKALEWKMINLNTHDLAIEINRKANDILHGMNKVATDKNAKDIIDQTKDFLEEAYGG